MSEQYQRQETKVYALTDEELKSLDEDSLAFIKEEYVEGGHSAWLKHPQYQNTETTSQTTILDKAMDFFKLMVSKQEGGFTHVGVGEKKYKNAGNNIYRSKWYKDGDKKKWNGNYQKKINYLEEIFQSTDFEVINNKLNSEKQKNWEMLGTLLNQGNNAVTFIIARYKDTITAPTPAPAPATS